MRNTSRIRNKKDSASKCHTLFNKTPSKVLVSLCFLGLISILLHIRLLYQFSDIEVESIIAKIKYKNSRKHFIPEDGFSACVVLKDDNDRLSEWLAYHWLLLPLKYLVVAVDPTGTTSPEKILKLWNNSDMGMEIILWNDIDFDHWINETMDDLHRHRDRQKHMYAQCQTYHKERNRTWVALIDPDEYIAYNIITADDPKVVGEKDTPASFMNSKYIYHMQNIRWNLTQVISARKTVFDFLQDHKNEEPWVTERCYLMPRLFFSALESSPNELAGADVSKYGFNISKFSTLRYFHHAKRDKWEYNHFGKVIIDLSRVHGRGVLPYVKNIHKPSPSCPKPLKPYSVAILRVNHYIGSYEQYSSRNDVRRSIDKFNDFGKVSDGTDFQLQHWLKDFVEMIGVKKSIELLKYAGIIDIGTTRLIDKEDYERVPPPPIYNYYYNEKGKLVGKKLAKKQLEGFKGVNIKHSLR